jgi:hypothetical protein
VGSWTARQEGRTALQYGTFGPESRRSAVGDHDALQVIVRNPLNQNRLLKAAEAFRLGFGDRLLDPVDFFEASLALLERIVTGGERIARPEPFDDELEAALAGARRLADEMVHGATRAPYLVIDLIEFAAGGGDLGEGLHREREAVAELLPARQAQASVYAFDLTQRRVKRQAWKPAVPGRPVGRIAVVGSGLMGAQVGALFLQRLEVVMKDIDPDVLDRARGHIERALDKRAARSLAEGKARFLRSLLGSCGRWRRWATRMRSQRCWSAGRAVRSHLSGTPATTKRSGGRELLRIRPVISGHR